MKKIHLFILGLIIVFSIFLRFYRLTDVPSGFFCDEAAIGYNAWKLLGTGKDEHGVPWPLFFRSFGDYRTPVPVYSNLLTVSIFGLSEYAVRFVSAFYGAGLVILMFLIGKKIRNSKFGLLNSFFIGINPWALHINRWGAEYSAYPFFFCLGLYVYLESKKKKNLIILSYIIFALTLYTYQPSWALIPIFSLIALFYWIYTIGRRGIIKAVIAGLLLVFISLPILNGIKSDTLLTRWHSSFNPDNIKSFGEKVNKIRESYYQHFDYKFLFINGENGIPDRFITRHSVRSVGEFYSFQIVFFLLGLVLFYKKKKNEWLFFLLLILYPLGSALSFQGPYVTRSLIGIIPFNYITSLGLIFLFKYIIGSRKITKNIVIMLLIVIVSISNYNYLKDYHIEYPKYSSDFWGWQYGSREVLKYFMQVEDDYDELIFAAEANAPEIFIPFYTQDSQKGCRNCYLGDVRRRRADLKQLFVASPNNLAKWSDQKYHVIKEFNYPDGKTAYIAVEYKN